MDKSANRPKVIRTSTVAVSLYFLLKGQLSFLNQQYEIIGVSGEDEHGFLKQTGDREGVRMVDIEMKRAISPINDLVSLWKLYRLFRREKPQIVHSITPKAGLLTMIAGYFAGVPVRIHMFTGLIFPTKTGMMQKLLIGMDRILCHFATHIFPEGQGVKKDLIAYRITNKDLKIIANGNVNGIDIEYFDPAQVQSADKLDLRESLEIGASDFVFIFVGRLVTDKGICEMVEAFKRLQADFPQAKLLLVGEFEEHLDPLPNGIVNEIKSNKGIIAAGYQHDVRKFYAMSDALIFPSYREGFPNVVLQAGAMGLPCIVSDISGCNEIIENDKNGIIIPVKNSEAAYDAMKAMVANPELPTRLKQNARGTIVSKYGQKQVWNAILNEYKTLDNV